MTSRNAVTGFMAAALLAVLSGCATASTGQAGAKPADSGYFLSARQKGQLIWTGRIQDEAGIWYDIWIVPGYVGPARQAGTYLRRTGSDFGEYFGRRKYRDLAKHSGDAFKWAYEDCLTDLTVKGVPRAWGRYWSRADDRTSKRIFGWWFAYPWAFMEGTVDTVVRVPVGLAGTLLGTAWGAAVVPGYYAVNSTVAGGWHFAVQSVALPAVGCAWNTMIAPPMALAGQKPAPSRVDGFWVRQLDATDTPARPEKAISPTDIEKLAQWGQALLAATQPYEDQRQELQKQIKAERDIINALEQRQSDLLSEERTAAESIGENQSLSEIVTYLRSQNFDTRRTSQAAAAVRQHLESLNTLSPAEVAQILRLLSAYPPFAVVNPPPPRAKTDPVKNSIRVIRDIE